MSACIWRLCHVRLCCPLERLTYLQDGMYACGTLVSDVMDDCLLTPVQMPMHVERSTSTNATQNTGHALPSKGDTDDGNGVDTDDSRVAQRHRSISGTSSSCVSRSEIIVE